MNNNKSLSGSRSLDFWLLGGASVFIYLVLNLIYFLKIENIPGISEYFTSMAGTMFILAALCNNPHFMASYKMAYFRGKKQIIDNYLQLLLYPALLIITILFSYFTFNTAIPIWLENILPNINLFDYKTLGALLLGSMVNMMFLTVGWHYAKQTFGASMVYAAYDKYRFNKIEKNLLRYSLLALWVLSFTSANLATTILEFSGLTYQGFNLPSPVNNIALIICNLMIGGLFLMFVFKYLKEKIIPSINMLIPIVAMYIWFYPGLSLYVFSFFLVPFFHSLQYLVFTYKVEKESILEKANILEKHESERLIFIKKYLNSFSFVCLTLILAGWLSFEMIPRLYDGAHSTESFFGFGFFFVAATLFINIHHYFIDNVLWGFNGENIKKLMR